MTVGQHPLACLRRAATGAGLLWLAACAGPSPTPPAGEAGTPGLARVEWAPPLRLVAVDGEAVAEPGAGRPGLELPPGPHAFRYEVVYGGSVVWCGAFHGTSGTLAGELAAGHRYRIGAYDDNWNCAIAVWLEDRTTNELVHGTAPRSLGLAPRQPPAAGAEPIQDPGPRFRALEEAAAAGDPEAAYQLGLWFLLGDPPLSRPDEATATRWFEQAAADGHAAASGWLARLRP